MEISWRRASIASGARGTPFMEVEDWRIIERGTRSAMTVPSIVRSAFPGPAHERIGDVHPAMGPARCWRGSPIITITGFQDVKNG